jgi:hypothetical protein
MADTKTVQEQVRTQGHVAQETAHNTFEAWNDLMHVTANWSLAAAEDSLRYSEELRRQASQTLQEGFTGYRRAYGESLDAWRSYVGEVYTILTHR